MKTLEAALLALLICPPLAAQESAAPPKEEAPKAPAETTEEPKAAPKIEEAKPEGELAYLKWAAQQDGSEAREAAIEDLESFIIRHRDDDEGQQAQLLLAETVEKKGDHYEAVLLSAKFLYEYPEAKSGFEAHRAYTDLVDKRMGRKIKGALIDLARPPKTPGTAQRLALLLHAITEKAGDYFYEPLEEEFARFTTRFPDYPQGDEVLLDWALMRAKNSKYEAAVLPYKKLLALYPRSSQRSKAQWEIAGLYADRIKDYNKAIDAFRELVELYPKDSLVEASLQRMAQLFRDKLKHYDMAFDVDERIIKGFPTTIGALHALQDQAQLQRDRLDKPMDAIKTCQRLAAMYRNSSGVEALQLAAKIARKDLKNYTLEIELRKQVAADFAQFGEAPEELFNAAEVYEDDLGDLDGAAKTYADVSAKFPEHKLAKKAQDRIQRVEKKKQKG